MTVFRRKRSRDTWHFCTNCEDWPKDDYVEKNQKPNDGEFCNQCRAKERQDTCRRTS
jgi:hypothetical protein